DPSALSRRPRSAPTSQDKKSRPAQFLPRKGPRSMRTANTKHQGTLGQQEICDPLYTPLWHPGQQRHKPNPRRWLSPGKAKARAREASSGWFVTLLFRKPARVWKEG